MREKKPDRFEVENKVKNLAKISTLPNIAFKVMDLVENPRTSVSVLANIISADHILTARVLKLANSAYYGFPKQISTINLAVVVLGFNALRDLVFGISVIDQFSASQFEDDLDVTQFWRHALFVGSGAKFLSKFLDYPVCGEVFVAGLLHDIGYPVLLQYFPDYFESARKYSLKKNLSFHEAEQKVLGFDHAEVGAWLAKGWNLPDKIVQAIRFHHSPEKNNDYPDLIRIIHIADHLSYTIEEGTGLERGLQEKTDDVVGKIKQYFSKNGHPIDFFQDKMRKEVEKVNGFLESLTCMDVNA
jgi:putative nucleotidyltransferase with HDIG domain